MNDTTASPNGATDRPATGESVHHAGNAVVFTKDGCVLLAQRAQEPVGLWGLPGVKAEPGEWTKAEAVRRLREKTRLQLDIDSLAAASSRYEGADSQGHYVTDSYYTVLDEAVPVEAGDDVQDVRWWRIPDALAERMPWDHHEIVKGAAIMAGLPVE
ncbi:NUDIX domain-containing protein [Amycolatopsis sp. WGS_07]|uniref:NUDIX domain-containing protein n=1 Tax=Amycolatopsis sp. WGS_07 TaxID=3076764 RepID=UPI0038735216